jgi:ABC-type sugar transport system substrate-binding protein
MRLRHLLTALAVCLAAASAPRAQTADAFKGKKVAFVPVALGFDLTEGWSEILKKQAKELGYDYVVRNPNFNADAGAQAISQLITEKPDVMVVHNPDVQVYARLIKKAQEAGIYVIQINMKSTAPSDYFVGADYTKLGEQAAEMMVKKCGEGSGKSGKIAIVQGVLTAAASVYQMTGINDVLSKHPEIKIVSNQAADWDSSKARAIMQTTMQQAPDLCGVIGFWDTMDVGTGSAIREAGKTDQVFLVTSGGGSDTACTNVENGTFGAELSYDVPRQGGDMNKDIRALLEKKPAAGAEKVTQITPIQVLSKETIKPGSCWSLKELQAAAQ